MSCARVLHSVHDACCVGPVRTGIIIGASLGAAMLVSGIFTVGLYIAHVKRKKLTRVYSLDHSIMMDPGSVPPILDQPSSPFPSPPGHTIPSGQPPTPGHIPTPPHALPPLQVSPPTPAISPPQDTPPPMATPSLQASFPPQGNLCGLAADPQHWKGPHP